MLVPEVDGRVMGMANITRRDRGKKELDAEILELEVYKDNEAAKNLYRKLGFEKAGEVKDGIKADGEYVNKVIMQKDLRD